MVSRADAYDDDPYQGAGHRAVHLQVLRLRDANQGNRFYLVIFIHKYLVLRNEAGWHFPNLGNLVTISPPQPKHTKSAVQNVFCCANVNK